MASKPKETKPYQFYKFKDHDPVLDQMRTIKDDAGSLNYNQIAELTGMSRATIDKWFNRKTTATRRPTMRPMFSSVANFTRAFGYDFRIVKVDNVRPSSGISFQRNIRAKSNLNNTAPAQH
jgi:transcriptional regulator with XRE-family HTH domain